MAIRHAQAVWTGTLREGSGTMKFANYNGPYTWASRFESGAGTNPEELVGAAHAGCYSMFLSSLITKAGFKPTRIQTTATVHLEEGPTITKIELNTDAHVPELDPAKFQELAAQAKANCPVSKALASVNIQLNAKLIG
ncbi:MAG: OsmC family protein [Chloroflexi bacterium]|nr:OsmC family protein [Chloroflexota bacterium]